MARCTKQEALETRSRILDAAEDMFHAQGVARTSLSEIAQAADVTRGAIYWHFRNKTDLFDAMCERIRLPMEAMVEAGADDGEADPLGRLRAACLFVLHETVANPHSRKVLGILFHKCEFMDDDDPIAVRQRECYLQGMTNLERILHNAVARNQLPPDLDTHLGGVAVHAALDGLLNNWLFAPDSFDLAGLAEPLIDATLDTLRYAPSLRRRGAGRKVTASAAH